MNLKNYISTLHTSTNRDYIKRILDDKIDAMEIAKRYDFDYWDGDRKFGYGGYKYIENRWRVVAESLIKDYKLTDDSKVLDVGCGKGFLLYEIKKILPKINLVGFDISDYALDNSKTEIKKFLKKKKAQDKYDFDDKYFDLAISLGTLHNLKLSDLKNAIIEINRVSKNQYIMVESYRNNKELFNLQCWALTCETFLSTDQWIWFLKENNYKGDYEFIFFE
jgi:ubiquinone/menaquinone biosynthesis C-methylase UbiE